MRLHANARTCPKSRRLIVRRIEDEGWSLAAAAEAAGVSERTAAKWLARWRAQAEPGLIDRSSAPKLRPTQLPAERVAVIESLRRLRMTAAEIAECLGVHVCVDDATRLAYAEVLKDEKGQTAAGFLRRAVKWFSSMGIRVERVMSDNGACYRSTLHAVACRELGLRHLRTQPYRPRTNGKAERFIQTLTRRWAHGALYGSSAERTAALSGWLTHYNFSRRHGSLGHKAPAARLAELRTTS